MPGRWKAWKTKPRFSTLPTAPWKSPTSRFPHSHSSYDETLFSQPPTTRGPWKSGNPKRRDSHFPTAPRPLRDPSAPDCCLGLLRVAWRIRVRQSSTKERPLSGPRSTQKPQPLRFTRNGTESPISCSSFDWKMLRAIPAPAEWFDSALRFSLRAYGHRATPPGLPLPFPPFPGRSAPGGHWWTRSSHRT